MFATLSGKHADVKFLKVDVSRKKGKRAWKKGVGGELTSIGGA